MRCNSFYQFGETLTKRTTTVVSEPSSFSPQIFIPHPGLGIGSGQLLCELRVTSYEGVANTCTLEGVRGRHRDCRHKKTRYNLLGQIMLSLCRVSMGVPGLCQSMAHENDGKLCLCAVPFPAVLHEKEQHTPTKILG